MTWHRSLYWRIAIGFVLFLAAMLVVQAMLFVWVVARSGRTVPGQSPGRFSETVALDLADALGREPELDVARYVRDQYAQDTHPFFVMLADGRMITSGSSTFPESLQRLARARLQRRGERFEGPRVERGGGGGGAGRGGGGGRAGGRGRSVRRGGVRGGGGGGGRGPGGTRLWGRPPPAPPPSATGCCPAVDCAATDRIAKDRRSIAAFARTAQSET